jgi:hypothetical protein
VSRLPSRPYVCAPALLAAHGFAVSRTPLHHIRRIVMPDARFALVRQPEKSTHKPVVFETLHGLADSIHRAAKGRPIQFVARDMEFRGEPAPRHGVNCYALDKFTQEQTEFLGWAWLGGGDWHLLSAAMPRASAGVSAIRAA